MKIRPGFLIFCALVFFFGDFSLTLAVMTAMAVHEAAHIAAAKLLGGKIRSAELTVWGAQIDVAGLGYAKEAITVAAGPAVSLAAAFAAAGMGYDLAAGVNLTAGLFNLLPARGLDGGRLAELLISSRGRFYLAYRFLRISTFCCALLLIVPLCAAFSRGIYNWSLLLAAVLLMTNAFY